MIKQTPVPISRKDALIVVDIQHDFLPEGSLAVDGGNTIIPTINALMPLFDCVVLTQDWHPKNHISFAENHVDKAPFSVINTAYGVQTLWPAHCVAGSPGAEFPKALDTYFAHLIIRKGYHPEIDSYSAFIEQDGKTLTGLAGWLREKDIERVFVCGLATDFCVCYTALDAAKSGFNVVVITDASAAINTQGSLDKAHADMKKAGVCLIDSHEILD